VSPKPFDTILKALSKESYQRRVRDFEFETVSAFDKPFDDLWERAVSQFAVIVLCMREMEKYC